MAVDHIRYDILAQEALRGVVHRVLVDAAKNGLPGEHHFYISFDTRADGVRLSPRMLAQYPEEMTVVLQHRFWDLLVNDVRFEVKLTFDSIPERLVVPFAAIKVFFDPSVPYGLQFDEGEGEGAGPLHLSAVQGETPHADAGAGEPLKVSTNSEGSRAEKKPRAARRPQSEKSAERPAAADKALAKHPAVKSSEPGPPAGPKVVSIDAFRKK